MSIMECWTRTKQITIFHHILTLLGNVAMGLNFRALVLRDSLYLENYLKLSSVYVSAIWSPGTLVVSSDLLLYYQCITLTMFVIIMYLAETVLLALSFIYFKTRHPWARILNAELSNDKLGQGARCKSEPILNQTKSEKITRHCKSEPNITMCK